jgi:drug/metabolite transporter (DMT)-like permease
MGPDTRVLEPHTRLLPILEALLVTLLWSSSFILIKLGLTEISPLFFAAVRYTLAFAILIIFNTAVEGHKIGSGIDSRTWGFLITLGLAGYTIAQGFQFVGLAYLPAVTTAFILNFTPLFVLFLGIWFLRETPSRLQLIGIAVALIGAYLYFQTNITINEIVGSLIVLASGWAWAIYMVITRSFQKLGRLSSLRLTTLTMGFGSLGMIILAIALEGFRPISMTGWSIILWLSFVNTALAFYLWNHILKTLRAYELSILQNTMLVQIAILAWIFLGEKIIPPTAVGMGLVILGVALVQFQANKMSQA